MKINKLFHWLYAILMALPLFAILTTCLIATFGKPINDTNQEVNINYKYETNEVNSIDDLIDGNIYHFDNAIFYDTYCLAELFLSDDSFLNIYFYDILNIYSFFDGVQWELDDFYIESNIECRLKFTHYGYEIKNIFLDYNDDSYNYINLNISDVHYSCDFVFYYYELNDVDTGGLFDVLLSSFSKCENIPIESVEVIETPNNFENTFYNAVNKVMTSDFFAWSYDSFLVVPFQYIVNLFGMPTNSIVVMLLSYWLSISIIWLVFDLVMYVPLLVHRWIDKAGID